ncbi:OLC1v1005365C1, partial [Oldenlandia corymbosa var. corymbosa]
SSSVAAISSSAATFGSSIIILNEKATAKTPPVAAGFKQEERKPQVKAHRGFTFNIDLSPSSTNRSHLRNQGPSSTFKASTTSVVI